MAPKNAEAPGAREAQPRASRRRGFGARSSTRPTQDKLQDRLLPSALIAGSNSLADLAARIRTEHEASVLAIKRGFKHAIACGRLLIEAKAQLDHGQYLPWLRDHCGVPERSARRYVELAAYAADQQIGQLADLSISTTADVVITDAVTDGTIAEAILSSSSDWDAVESYYAAPFCGADFFNDDGSRKGDALDDIFIKIKRQIQMPWVAGWCFDVTDLWSDDDDKPHGHFVTFRLCPWDQLIETAERLAPVVRRPVTEHQAAIRFHAESFASMQQMTAAVEMVNIFAMWMLGVVLNEIKYRHTISEERYQEERDEAHANVMARLERRLADLKHQRDGDADRSRQME